MKQRCALHVVRYSFENYYFSLQPHFPRAGELKRPAPNYNTTNHLPFFNSSRSGQNGRHFATLSNAFSLIKCMDFAYDFTEVFFLSFKLTIFHHWLRNWLGTDQARKPLPEPVVVRLLTHICVTRSQLTFGTVTCYYEIKCQKHCSITII